jgi:hypothetical protein
MPSQVKFYARRNCPGEQDLAMIYVRRWLHGVLKLQPAGRSAKAKRCPSQIRNADVNFGKGAANMARKRSEVDGDMQLW